MMLAKRCVTARPAVPAEHRRSVISRATRRDDEPRVALPLATLVAATLLTGSAMPQEAYAAKSSGRVGGTTGFKSRKVDTAAPTQTRQQTTIIHNTTVLAPAPVMAPSLFGGFGYGGFGYRFMPSFVMPVPYLGGILQVVFVVTLVSLVFGLIKAVIAATFGAKKKKDDSWGDL
ncbi:hypothetical protein V8C86DRAFT_2464391 [Haematococcus lacustris]